MNLFRVSFQQEIQLAGTSFFHNLFKKFMGNFNQLNFIIQYNIFYKYRYFFFESVFKSLLNHRLSQSDQELYSLCCDSPCFCLLSCTLYGPLHCFSIYFWKSKEIGILRPKFPVFLVAKGIRSSFSLFSIQFHHSSV